MDESFGNASEFSSVVGCGFSADVEAGTGGVTPDRDWPAELGDALVEVIGSSGVVVCSHVDKDYTEASFAISEGPVGVGVEGGV